MYDVVNEVMMQKVELASINSERLDFSSTQNVGGNRLWRDSTMGWRLLRDSSPGHPYLRLNRALVKGEDADFVIEPTWLSVYKRLHVTIQ